MFPIIILAAACLLASPAAAQTDLQTDRAAHPDIAATGDYHGTRNPDHPCTQTPCRPYDDWGASDDVCRWSGMTCHGVGNAARVVGLDLGFFDHERRDWKDDPIQHSVRALPESIGQLSALQTLYLDGNQLSVLPESIGQLSALESLDLNNHQLIELPESVEQLSALETMDLVGNQLSALPPDFLERVTHLTSLLVDPSVQACPRHTQLFGGHDGQSARCVWNGGVLQADRAALLDIVATGDDRQTFHGTRGEHPCTQTPCRPYDDWGASDDVCRWSGVTCCVVGNAMRVVGLDLGFFDWERQRFKSDPIQHSVRALPESIGQLSALQTLDLDGNQLSVLPESIGQLSSLESLDLNNHQLIELPESIGQLSALEYVDVHGNQLSALPESIGKRFIVDADVQTCPPLTQLFRRARWPPGALRMRRRLLRRLADPLLQPGALLRRAADGAGEHTTLRQVPAVHSVQLQRHISARRLRASG